MISKTSLCVALSFCFAFGATASAGQIEAKTFHAKSYDGSRNRNYKVFVPSAYTGQTPVPMVMVLHGCKQTHDNMINETRFKEIAERDNFIVVYPFITSFDGVRDQNCWGFFLDQHVHQGKGEAEDLYQIALEVEAAFKIDPNRRYVTGLSSGAGMTVALAVARSEFFAAAAPVAGLPYSETASSVGRICVNPGTFKPVSNDVAAMRTEQGRPEEQRPVPIIAIHSRNDCVVNVKGSENIRDSWIARYVVDSTPVATANCSAEGVACAHTKFGSVGRTLVETVFYDGERGDSLGAGSHYWVGDNSGSFANPTGPSASELAWDFFKAHPFAEHPALSVSIASASASGTSVNVAGSASASAGSIVEVAVQLDGLFPQPQKIASGTANWTATFANLPNNAFYVPVVTVKANDGLTASERGQPIAVGSPVNAPPVASIQDALVNGDCVTVRGAASDPDGRLTAVEVQLGVRGFKPATFSQTSYEYQECGLSGGVYTTQARATDSLGATSAIASGPNANVSHLQVVTANWQSHMSAGRLRVYSSPCISIGFGACDLGFSEIFLANQFNPFPLQRKPDSQDWYVDHANIP